MVKLYGFCLSIAYIARESTDSLIIMCMGSKNNHKATHTCVSVVEVTGYGMGRGQGPYGISTVGC